MNPRIRELQHQAMSSILNGNDPDGDVERMYIPAEFTTKFAELIVRECVELNRQELSFSAFARMLDKYEDHFGVER
jgi:hypothetical protein